MPLALATSRSEVLAKPCCTNQFGSNFKQLDAAPAAGFVGRVGFSGLRRQPVEQQELQHTDEFIQ
jgi:hypothetical protein